MLHVEKIDLRKSDSFDFLARLKGSKVVPNLIELTNEWKITNKDLFNYIVFKLKQ